MHLAQSYSLSAGQTLGRSHIEPEYYPLNLAPKSYIVLQAVSKEIKNYSYFSDCIRLLKFFLPELEVVQLGAANEQPIDFCKSLMGATNWRQSAYIIQNSLLYFGVDSVSAHLAGCFNIPVVALYSNNYVNNVSPYGLDPDKFIPLFAPELTKPIFSFDIGSRPLDKIRPNQIVSSILKLLGRSDITLPSYSWVGASYANKMTELIPIKSLDKSQFPYDVVSVRMDVHFNEQVLFEQAHICKLVIHTDRPINIDLLKSIKPQVLQLVYEIKDLNVMDKKWFQALQKAGIKYDVYSYLPKEVLNTIKLDYCELMNIFDKTRPAGVEVKGKKYLSGKLVFCNGKLYNSIFDYKIGRTTTGKELLNFGLCVDCPDFIQEIEHFAIVD